VKGPGEKEISAARKGLSEAAEALASGLFDMVVLDEVLYALSYDLISVSDVIDAVRSRHPGVDVVLTGRNAPPEVVELGDTVTEFKEIKHPFGQGIKARKGIEY
jgi:cob(I)alamin adenosyltransferase